MSTVSVLGTIVALPALFVVPGWLVLRRLGLTPLTALYCGFGLTAAYAGVTVGLAVLLPWSVRATCLGGLAVLLAGTVYCGLTAPRPLIPASAELTGVAVFLVAFAAAACFVVVPSQPAGSWASGTAGPGRVDTPRWQGMPSDNILPYRTGQVAFFKETGQLRDRFGDGWWISDRTPLVGLDFAFTVGALGVHMRSDNPVATTGPAVAMVVKDRYAWWLYNLVAVMLATASVLAVFFLALVWRGNSRLATAAALVAALAPGLFLNEIYTWPKAATAYFVLIALALALRRRALGAGAFAALGYLCHPSGGFWIPSVAITLLSMRGAWSWGALVRFVAGVVAVALPWQIFTSLYMHAVSRELFWSLGSLVEDRNNLGVAWSHAWHQFIERGIAGNVWVRVESTATSLLPTDITGPGLANPDPHLVDAKMFWARAHGFSIWGMLGLVLFPATVLYIARLWPRDRPLLLRTVLPYVVVAILAAGFPDTWSSQSAYPLIGLLAIFAGEMLLAVTTRIRWFLWGAIAFELLTVAYVCEYSPYNASAPIIVLFAVLGIGAHLVLLAALGRTIGLWTWPLLRGRPAPRPAMSPF